MNRLHCFKYLSRGIPALLLVSVFLFGMPAMVPVSTGLAGPDDALPEIISIQLEVSEVVVTVRVPKGITKVTLEGRSRLGSGNWAPRAVERVDGSGGLLVIRIAYSKANEILRVRGDDKEELPAAFYKGTTDVNGQKDDTDGGVLMEDGGVPPAPGRGNLILWPIPRMPARILVMLRATWLSRIFGVSTTTHFTFSTLYVVCR